MRNFRRNKIQVLINRGYLHCVDGGDGGGGGSSGAVGDSGGDGGEKGGVGENIIAEIKAENERLKKHLNELLNETKAAKEKRRKVEEEAARKRGDFEALLRSSEQEREQLKKERDELKSLFAKKTIKSEALKMASKLADGDNVELLSDFIQRRLKVIGEEIKVTDKNGNLTVSTIADLEKEFSNDKKFAALLKGKQSSGGGATGGSGGAAGKNVITRTEFDALTPAAKMKFVKGGGAVVD